MLMRKYQNKLIWHNTTFASEIFGGKLFSLLYWIRPVVERLHTLPASGAGAGTQASITAVARGTGGASCTSFVHLCSSKIASFRIIANHKCGEPITILISFLQDRRIKICSSKQKHSDLIVDQATAELLGISPDQLGVVTYPGAEPGNLMQWKHLFNILFITWRAQYCCCWSQG